MIALLAPAGLAALSALALPVLIHLVRRRDEQRLRFAAMRWLGERQVPRARVRLHDPLLLALRLLLLATLALLLAAPVWQSQEAAPRPWVVLAPGVAPATARAAIGEADADWHLLAPGFPLLADPAAALPSVEPQPVASLIRELDGQLPAAQALTMVVPRELGGLDGGALQLRRAIDWRVVDGRSPGATAPAQELVIYGAAGRERELAVWSALLEAWRADGLDLRLQTAAPDDPAPAVSAWALWLPEAPPSPAVARWLRSGGRLLTIEPGAAGTPAVVDATGKAVLVNRPVGAGRLLALSARLMPEDLPALREPAFPQRLRRALQAAALPPDRADADAVAPQRGGGAALAPARTPLDALFAGFAALLFAAERLRAQARPKRA